MRQLFLTSTLFFATLFFLATSTSIQARQQQEATTATAQKTAKAPCDMKAHKGKHACCSNKKKMTDCGDKKKTMDAKPSEAQAKMKCKEHNMENCKAHAKKG